MRSSSESGAGPALGGGRSGAGPAPGQEALAAQQLNEEAERNQLELELLEEKKNGLLPTDDGFGAFY